MYILYTLHNIHCTIYTVYNAHDVLGVSYTIYAVCGKVEKIIAKRYACLEVNNECKKNTLVKVIVGDSIVPRRTRRNNRIPSDDVTIVGYYI